MKSKLFVIFLFLVLLTSLSLAATPSLEAEYLTIVGEDAPTSDVITAANFAATIKQTGITFTGATDKDALEGYEQSDLDDHYFVVIDGNSVLLLGEANAQIENYFEEQGFIVETKNEAELEDLAVTENYVAKEQERNQEEQNTQEQDESESKNQDAREEKTQETKEIFEQEVDETASQNCQGCEVDGLCYEEGDVLFVDGGARYCDGENTHPRKQLYDSCEKNYECAASIACTNGTCGEKQGFVSKVLNWFASLF